MGSLFLYTLARFSRGLFQVPRSQPYKRRRRDGFYPAPDFRDREAEDMAGVFDIDLDQPEDAGSEDELEEGVRPGVPGGVPKSGLGACTCVRQWRWCL